MTSHLHIRTGLSALLALVVVLAMSTQAAAQIDLRSPDARDAAAQAPPGTDLRSPDARDPSLHTAGPPTWPVDPDLITPPASAVEPPATFQWDDAAVGAGAMFGAVLLLAGGAALIGRRHRSVAARTVVT